jgi:FtsZ-binding cell division protein ZapB
LTVANTYERPDLSALTELDRVLHNITEELAAWRRRCLKAEAELKEAQASGGVVAGTELKESRQRVIDLETENQALRQRIDSAKERLRVLAGRLSFLEQHGGGNAA